jgi:hypothetical protein
MNQRLIYASSDGDIERLVDKLKREDTDLDDDIQSRKARIDTLLAALGDKDGQIEANNALNEATESQSSKADAHAAVEQVARSCVNFAQDSGLEVNLAEAAAHELQACSCGRFRRSRISPQKLPVCSARRIFLGASRASAQVACRESDECGG